MQGNKGKRWLALAMAAALAVSLLAACGGGPGSCAGVALNASKIERLLQARDVDAAVTTDEALSDAVAKIAGTLAAGDFDDIDAADVKTLVAQETGAAPLVCEIASDAPYWGDSPLRYANRYQERAADLLDDLGGGDYKVAAARFTTQDNVDSVLFVAVAA